MAQLTDRPGGAAQPLYYDEYGNPIYEEAVVDPTTAPVATPVQTGAAGQASQVAAAEPVLAPAATPASGTSPDDYIYLSEDQGGVPPPASTYPTTTLQAGSDAAQGYGTASEPYSAPLNRGNQYATAPLGGNDTMIVDSYPTPGGVVDQWTPQDPMQPVGTPGNYGETTRMNPQASPRQIVDDPPGPANSPRDPAREARDALGSGARTVWDFFENLGQPVDDRRRVYHSAAQPPGPPQGLSSYRPESSAIPPPTPRDPSQENRDRVADMFWGAKNFFDTAGTGGQELDPNDPATENIHWAGDKLQGLQGVISNPRQAADSAQQWMRETGAGINRGWDENVDPDRFVDAGRAINEWADPALDNAYQTLDRNTPHLGSRLQDFTDWWGSGQTVQDALAGDRPAPGTTQQLQDWGGGRPSGATQQLRDWGGGRETGENPLDIFLPIDRAMREADIPINYGWPDVPTPEMTLEGLTGLIGGVGTAGSVSPRPGETTSPGTDPSGRTLVTIGSHPDAPDITILGVTPGDATHIRLPDGSEPPVPAEITTQEELDAWILEQQTAIDQARASGGAGGQGSGEIPPPAGTSEVPASGRQAAPITPMATGTGAGGTSRPSGTRLGSGEVGSDSDAPDYPSSRRSGGGYTPRRKWYPSSGGSRTPRGFGGGDDFSPFGEGFPFNRPDSPIRQMILALIAEAMGRTGRQGEEEEPERGQVRSQRGSPYYYR